MIDFIIVLFSVFEITLCQVSSELLCIWSVIKTMMMIIII